MGQRNSKCYDTDDLELIRFLESVMGSASAARVFWSYLLSDPCQIIELPTTSGTGDDCMGQRIEVGGAISSSVVVALDRFCVKLKISRFSAILSTLAVVLERYTGLSSFILSHNYGVTGTANRKLRFPVTRVDLDAGQDGSDVTFETLCLAQHELIQKSSYHLCIDKLPEMDGPAVDRSVGVWLLESSSGHTQDRFASGVIETALSLIMDLEPDGNIVLQLSVDSERVSHSFATALYQQLIFTLETSLLSSGDIRTIETVPPNQISELLDQSVFSLPFASAIDFPELQVTLDELIMSQRLQSPDRIALRQHSPIYRELSYNQLALDAKKLGAEIFSNFPVKGNSRIGILLPRGMDQVIAIVAIHMVGCAYVPMDPLNHPAERIEFILRDSECVGFITDSSVLVAKSFTSKLPVILLDRARTADDDSSFSVRPRVEKSPENIAYVIYTSGSTGNPKGVQVPHKGIVNDVFCVFKHYMQSNLSIISNVLFATNICFDAHVDEVFLPLIFGGSITCLDSTITETTLDPEWNLSFVQSTPSVLQVIDIPPTVSCVLIGGEALTKKTIEKVLSSNPDRLILNGYGPTETTNESSVHVVKDSDDFKSIGKPIWNTQFYILDSSSCHFAPKHAWGELYIGGIGVTRGYCNLPDLTQKVFLFNHPLFPDQTVYKTGDVVRVNASGDLEFRGRKQNCGQIKLRGYRIELGEIEYAILSNNSWIKEAHVSVVSDQIVAHIAPKNPDQPVINYGSLSEYMKPTSVVRLDSFPRNISGKLDLKSFPRMHACNSISSRSDKHERLVQAFMSSIENLDGGNISPDSNFFTIGGNSLNVLNLRKFLADSYSLPIESIKLQLLFQLQTVGAIGDYLEELSDPSIKKSHMSGSDQILVPLGKTGSIPFFCVHAAGGQIHTYSALGMALGEVGPDVQLVGVQDPSLSQGPIARLSSFEALGALYAKQINEYQKQGPIYLGGHSSGGSIAFEAARCLSEEFTREVGGVFLIDTDFPDCMQENVSSGAIGLLERLDEVRHYVVNGWREGLVDEYIKAMTTVSESHGKGKTWQLIKALLPSRRSDDSASRWSSDLLDMISLLSHHLKIEKRYRVENQKKFEFPIICFRPANELNETPGWASLTVNRFVVVDVPDVNHYNLIRAPAVKLIATVITDFIISQPHTRGA